MKTENRTCTCCKAHYQIPTDYWCELPFAVIKDGKTVFPTPKGLCEFCDPDNSKWYVKEKPCHA